MGDITVNGVDYSELQIIEVSITTQKIQYYEMLSFARDIAQGISYPTLLVLKYGQTHYRFFAFIIHKGKIDSYKSIVDNSKCSGWIWYQKEKLHTYDKALLNNMMFFFYKSRNIYDISLNLLSLYEKHSKIYYTQRKLSHNDAYYNSHKTINAIVEQERREVNIIKNKF